MNDEIIPIRVTYEYELPDHEYELWLLQNARCFHNALLEIDEELRKTWKYGEDVKLGEYADGIRKLIPEVTFPSL